MSIWSNALYNKLKNIQRNGREYDRLQNENKIIFNNKLKSDKNLYIKSQYTTQQKY